jgi:hypothetical protein
MSYEHEESVRDRLVRLAREYGCFERLPKNEADWILENRLESELRELVKDHERDIADAYEEAFGK